MDVFHKVGSFKMFFTRLVKHRRNVFSPIPLATGCIFFNNSITVRIYFNNSIKSNRDYLTQVFRVLHEEKMNHQKLIFCWREMATWVLRPFLLLCCLVLPYAPFSIVLDILHTGLRSRCVHQLWTNFGRTDRSDPV